MRFLYLFNPLHPKLLAIQIYIEESYFCYFSLMDVPLRMKVALVQCPPTENNLQEQLTNGLVRAS